MVRRSRFQAQREAERRRINRLREVEKVQTQTAKAAEKAKEIMKKRE